MIYQEKNKYIFNKKDNMYKTIIKFNQIKCFEKIAMNQLKCK